MTTADDPRFLIAAARRMLYRNGLDSIIGGHVSMRADDGESFWITPIQYFDETLPRHVGRLTFTGEFVEGDEPLALSPGIAFHPAIYRARPDVNCVVHTHAFYVAVLSTLEIPFRVYHDHGALFIDDVAYFQDSAQDNPVDGGDAIAAALGEKHVMILKNHGSVNVASSIQRAVGEAIYLEWAARHQLASMQAGGVEMHPDTARFYQAAYRKTGAGELTWESNMRRLRLTDPDLFEAVSEAWR